MKKGLFILMVLMMGFFIFEPAADATSITSYSSNNSNGGNTHYSGGTTLFGGINTSSLYNNSNYCNCGGIWTLKTKCKTAVPEPNSLLLLGSGMIGLWIWRKRFSKVSV